MAVQIIGAYRYGEILIGLYRVRFFLSFLAICSIDRLLLRSFRSYVKSFTQSAPLIEGGEEGSEKCLAELALAISSNIISHSRTAIII